MLAACMHICDTLGCQNGEFLLRNIYLFFVYVSTIVKQRVNKWRTDATVYLSWKPSYGGTKKNKEKPPGSHTKQRILELKTTSTSTSPTWFCDVRHLLVDKTRQPAPRIRPQGRCPTFRRRTALQRWALRIYRLFIQDRNVFHYADVTDYIIFTIVNSELLIIMTPLKNP